MSIYIAAVALAAGMAGIEHLIDGHRYRMTAGGA